MKMRALLIDPTTRTITETELDSNDWRNAARVLGCESIESAGVLNGDIFDRWHGVYVDSKALLDESNPPTHYFEINTAQGWSYPIGSKGVVHGGDRENTAAATMTVDEVRAIVRFSERRFRGIRSIPPHEIDHPVWGRTVVFGIEPIMPRVDTREDEAG
jgi:hypothetical protein